MVQSQRTVHDFDPATGSVRAVECERGVRDGDCTGQCQQTAAATARAVGDVVADRRTGDVERACVVEHAATAIVECVAARYVAGDECVLDRHCARAIPHSATL